MNDNFTSRTVETNISQARLDFSPHVRFRSLHRRRQSPAAFWGSVAEGRSRLHQPANGLEVVAAQARLDFSPHVRFRGSSENGSGSSLSASISVGK
jgi:hypothetical protein